MPRDRKRLLGYVEIIQLILGVTDKKHSQCTWTRYGMSVYQEQWSLCFEIYQSPLILTALFQHNLINVSYLTACYLYQVMMTFALLNDVANDAETTQKSKIT